MVILVLLFPSDISSEVTIITKDQTTLQILVVYGRELRKKDVFDGQNSINLSGLPSGILIFVVRDLRYKVLKE
jgi:hypothetical protein